MEATSFPNYLLNIEVNRMDGGLSKQDVNNLETAIMCLNEHMKNKLFFKPYAFRMLSKCSLEEDFSSKNMRQSYYLECTFNKCDFFETGFPGSVFANCTFINCNFNYADFYSCCFKDCQFVFTGTERPMLEATRFGKSVFQNCTLRHAILHYVDLSSCVIEGGIISDLKCISIRVEDTKIFHSKLIDIRFKSQNFDFLLIQDIQTENLVIPFPAVPCIFNGIQYLQMTADNVRISSYQQGRFERISKDEYLGLIPYFETYYRETENYFPLSNVYLAKGQPQKAFNALVSGVIQSVGLKNFRMISHYCQAVRYSNLFSPSMKHSLYSRIMMALNQANLSSMEKRDMDLYLGQIKEDLLNEHTMPHVDINLATNIASDDYQRIAWFIRRIESLITKYVGDNETHHIELRHDSPVSFFVQLTADPERLVVFLAAIFTIYLGGKELAQDLFSAAKKIKERRAASTKATATADLHEPPSEDTRPLHGIYIKSASYCIFNCNILDPTLQNAYVENPSESPLPNDKSDDG